MSFYIGFFIFILSLCLFSEIGIRRNGKRILVIDPVYYIGIIYAFFICFLITALRYNVGTDYIAYQNYAKENILGVSFFEALKDSELFFVLFSKISYCLCGNMQFFYLLVSAFTYYFLAKGILFYDKKIFLVFLVFFISTCFFISLNVMRQICACAIFIFATKYFLLILLALCWHKCSVFFIPFYFFRRIKIKKSFFVLVLGIFLLKRVLNIFVVNFLGSLGISLNYYFLMQDGVSSRTFIVISLFILLYFYFFVNRDFSEISNLFFNICLVEFFISVFIDGIPGGYRLIYLFWPFYIIICPYLMRESKNKLYGMFFIVCVLLMFGFYYYNMQIKGNANEVVPYQSILKGIF
jgi:transmembrane protein EpsG